MKKVLSLLMVLAMLLSVLPATVNATAEAGVVFYNTDDNTVVTTMDGVSSVYAKVNFPSKDASLASILVAHYNEKGILSKLEEIATVPVIDSMNTYETPAISVVDTAIVKVFSWSATDLVTPLLKAPGVAAKMEEFDRPTATVTKLDTAALPVDLTFAMNFKADKSYEGQLLAYGNWYADYVLTVNKTVTYSNQDGADAYLAGQYDSWSADWVKVPNKAFTQEANAPVKIMETAAELYGKKGLKYTYSEVYNTVKDFDCGVFFSDAFLAVNPDLAATLELRIYNPADESESYAVGEAYTYYSKDVAAYVSKFVKASTAKDEYISGKTVTVGELFADAGASVAVKGDNVMVTAEGSNASVVYTANATDWTQGTVTFQGNGALNITIDDAYYCVPTTISVNVKALTNVALNKPITAGRYDANWSHKTWLNDGNYTSGVYNGGEKTDNADGVVSGLGWFQIDLGARYQIDNIALYKAGAAWDTTYCFNIMVSNTPDFSDGKAIALATYPDAAPFVAVEETEDTTDAKLELPGDGNYYRYIRLEKTQFGYDKYTELEVYADEAAVIYPSNIALNKAITAGMYDVNWSHKAWLNDGNDTTGVSGIGATTDNKDGVPSDKTNAWYQIDLGKRYLIDEIVLKYRNSANWSTAFCFKIMASNSEDFSDDSTVEFFQVGDAGTGLNPVIVQGNGKYYRYVRLQKLPGANNFGYDSYDELEVYAYEDNFVVPANVAISKPVTSGRYDGYQKRENLTDGDDNTGVSYDGGVYSHSGTDNADGTYSDHSNNWWQIDLGKQYQVENIVLKYTTENWATPYNFKISVSNSPDFADGTAVTLCEVGDEGASGNPLTVLGDGNKYQYVRFEKVAGTYSPYGYGKYTELEVYAYED